MTSRRDPTIGVTAFGRSPHKASIEMRVDDLAVLDISGTVPGRDETARQSVGHVSSRRYRLRASTEFDCNRQAVMKFALPRTISSPVPIDIGELDRDDLAASQSRRAMSMQIA